MWTSATESTADELLDYLASDGRRAEWTNYVDLADWESLHDLLGECGLVGRVALNLAGRELGRSAAGGFRNATPVAPAGIARVGKRVENLDCILASEVRLGLTDATG